MTSLLSITRRLAPVALATTLAACGARPAAPLGESAHRLTAAGTPTAADLGFWRFYTVVEGAARGRGVCELDADRLPAGLQNQPISSTMLFDDGASVPAPDAVAERVFCMHTTQISRSAVDSLPDMATPMEFVPPRVSALAEREIKRAAAARFAQESGALRQSLAGPAVRVSVLDSAALGMPGVGAVSPHGEDMALLIRGAVCPGNEARCAVQVETDVALDLDADADGLRLAADGGRFGDPGVLARAIHRAVDRAAQDDVPLVINLSLGWLDDGDDRVSVQAVRRAIEQARDRGALVIAAAGNDQDGDVDPGTGLMLPARWSTEQRRDGTPLVISVGGMGLGDEPLANARDYGTDPSVWAYGAHAPADARFLTPGERHPRLDGPMWTGSSVATAVISATAAALLSREETPTEIGLQLTQANDRVQLCAAAGQPCADGHVDGPDLRRVGADAPIRGTTRSIAECGGLAHGPSARPIDACPSAVERNPIGLPRVDPQPEFPGCEVCGFDANSSKLVVKLSADTTALTLRITESSGAIKWISLDPSVLAGQQRTYQVQLEGFKALAVVGKASVEGKSSTFEDPVMVW